MTSKMVDETFNFVDAEIVQHTYNNNDNYRIEDGDPTSRYACIYCSSHGIYFPNTETEFGGCALVPVVLYLLVSVFGAGYARAINAILLLMPGVVIGSQIKYSGLAIIFTQFKKQPQNKFGGQQVHYTFRKVSNYTVHRQIFQIKYILALNSYCVFY